MLVEKQGETHKHVFLKRYLFDRPVGDRPKWAREYSGNPRWIEVYICKVSGCSYRVAENITYDKPDSKLILKE